MTAYAGNVVLSAHATYTYQLNNALTFSHTEGCACPFGSRRISARIRAHFLVHIRMCMCVQRHCILTRHMHLAFVIVLASFFVLYDQPLHTLPELLRPGHLFMYCHWQCQYRMLPEHHIQGATSSEPLVSFVCILPASLCVHATM